MISRLQPIRRSVSRIGKPNYMLGDLRSRGRYYCAAVALLVAALVNASTPIPVPLLSTEEQLAKADLAAFVSVRVAHSDLSRHTIYRGRVTEPIKGSLVDQTVCFQTVFAPFSLEVNTEYLVFLERGEPSEVIPQQSSALADLCPAGVPRFRTLDRGSQPLPVRFTNDVPTLCPEEWCPSGAVAVDVAGLGLPKFVEFFPKRAPPDTHRFWVRKAQLVLALRWQMGAEKH